jgi:hypothetical protein
LRQRWPPGSDDNSAPTKFAGSTKSSLVSDIVADHQWQSPGELADFHEAPEGCSFVGANPPQLDHIISIEKLVVWSSMDSQVMRNETQLRGRFGRCTRMKRNCIGLIFYECARQVRHQITSTLPQGIHRLGLLRRSEHYALTIAQVRTVKCGDGHSRTIEQRIDLFNRTTADERECSFETPLQRTQQWGKRCIDHDLIPMPREVQQSSIDVKE